MALYGLFTRGSAIYEKSLDMNINLIWGGLMFVFGLVMYIMGRRPRRLVAGRVELTEQPLGGPPRHWSARCERGVGASDRTSGLRAK